MDYKRIKKAIGGNPIAFTIIILVVFLVNGRTTNC
jgi:hypothetical protein